MAIDGYYYLHENGALIWKRYIDAGQIADFRESPLVKHFWSIDLKSREDAWAIVIEALAIGADPARVKELAALWQCDDTDAAIFAERNGFDLFIDGNAWCAARRNRIDLASCPHGFGVTALEAMADLAKQLGMRAQKTWGPTFKSLVQCPCDTAKSVDAQCAATGECAL